MSSNKYRRPDETPAPKPGATPDTTPAADEEIATDLSEVARARLSNTDKTQTGGSVAEDALDASTGIAGTPPDDDTAAAGEGAPAAAPGKGKPPPQDGRGQGPGAPRPAPPGGAGG